MHTPKREYLTPHEAAALLRTGPSTIFKYVLPGRLKGYRPGRKLLVCAADLDRLVESAEVRRRQPTKKR